MIGKLVRFETFSMALMLEPKYASENISKIAVFKLDTRKQDNRTDRHA